MQVMGEDDLLLLRFQIGDQRVIGEIAAPPRHAGQHDHRHAACGKGAAGRRTHRIVKDGTIPGQIGLLQIARWHFAAKHRVKVVPYLVGDLRVEVQRPVKGAADRFLGQIVVGRP